MGTERADLEVTREAAGSGPIERICEQFEAAFKASRPLAIEQLLVGWDEPERSKLLSELLLIELVNVGAKGQTLTPQIYQQRFPEHRHVVTDVFDRWLGSRLTVGSDEVVEDALVMQSQFGQLRRHAEGGLGVVFRADDRRLSREVAVKFIRSTLASDTESRNRFRLEAEITSRLEHPGIVPIYGLGDTADGELFYAMRFIRGQTLEDLIDLFFHGRKSRGPAADGSAVESESPADHERHYRELLERFIAVCKTMAYAHNRGIVHRDIKPANVMLGRYGETIVIDWGLAMPVGRQGVFRESGEMTLLPSAGNSSGDSWGGTPAYMSPEQAAGTLALTPASDIYSLGVVLYKILSGTVPFVGTLHELRSKVIRGDFKRPSVINRRVSKSIESVCLKAMALAPTDRYETALDLARDVENYLADVPVTAYEEPFSLKLARWGRRHRALSQAALIGLVLLTLGGMGATAVFSRLRSAAVDLQQSEHEMRKRSLAVSARFAARTIADKIDIRLRVIEGIAGERQLHELMGPVDDAPQDESLREPLQRWLEDQRVRHGHIEDYAWSICSSDGSQVARYPRCQENGQPVVSLGQKFAYRDYFHGRLSDFETGPPIEHSHVSVAMESTNGGLIVVFSTPIKAGADQAPIGVISMSIELGRFADLDIALPPGQKVILVDARRYFMKLAGSDERGPSGEGLLLHHPDLAAAASPNEIPHMEPSIVKYMREKSPQQLRTDNLLPATYRDPLAVAAIGSPLAAFAPVILTARPDEAEVHRINWFVIIQQQ
jgi:serine/threonine protein kinase